MAYTKIENFDNEITEELKKNYSAILSFLGENPQREGLIKTPERVAKAMQYFTQGYFLNATDILNSAKFSQNGNEMIVVKNIEIYSMCEHHLVPFFGKAHVAYLPKKHIVGLSKIARVVDVFARRLQVQEKLTQQILTAIKEALDPYGVAVVVDCQHLCMMMRGVGKQNSITTTSAFCGAFEKQETRNEFLTLIPK